jgi:hypothetical protein
MDLLSQAKNGPQREKALVALARPQKRRPDLDTPPPQVRLQTRDAKVNGTMKSRLKNVGATVLVACASTSLTVASETSTNSPAEPVVEKLAVITE